MTLSSAFAGTTSRAESAMGHPSRYMQHSTLQVTARSVTAQPHSRPRGLHSSCHSSCSSISQLRLPTGLSVWTRSGRNQILQQGKKGGQARRQQRCRGVLSTTASLQNTLVGLGVFFTPTVIALIYATIKGKGNTKDGLSRMLTVRKYMYWKCPVFRALSAHTRN